MSDTKIRERSEIPVEFTWNAESVFPDRSAGEIELEALAAVAFLDPELIAAGEETVRGWITGTRLIAGSWVTSSANTA